MSITASLIICLVFFIPTYCKTTDDIALEYMNKVNLELEKHLANYTLSDYMYYVNMKKENLDRLNRASGDLNKFYHEKWAEYKKFRWEKIGDKDLKRQFQQISIKGLMALPVNKYVEIENLIHEMEEKYMDLRICSYKGNNCSLNLYEDADEIMRSSRDPQELKHIWLEVKKSVTSIMKAGFIKYISYMTEAARANNMKNAAQMWQATYEGVKIKDVVQSAWVKIKPLYVQLHAYVRSKLRSFYGDVVSEKGPIPAHLLGKMFGQTWDNILDIVLPYPQRDSFDFSNLYKDATHLTIYRVAEEFIISLGFNALPKSFWNNSVFAKAEDRQSIWYTKSWIIPNIHDFRIINTGGIGMGYYFRSHYMVGHMSYGQMLRTLPLVYQDEALPGLYNGVGKLYALSSRALKHFSKSKRLQEKPPTVEDSINSLFLNSLIDVAALPFSHIMDLWRWHVFSNEKSSNVSLNCKWWEYRTSLQGVEPPVNRTEEDFDPGGKYNVISNKPYIENFIGTLIQYQLHRSLCKLSGLYSSKSSSSKPLHLCDLFGSMESGERLRKFMALGKSKPWYLIWEMVTGEKDINPNALLEFYKPLMEWLVRTNKAAGSFIGWESSNKNCV